MSNIKTLKEKRKLFAAMTEKSRQLKTPFCVACARQDDDKNEMKSFDDYTKGIKELDRQEMMVKNGMGNSAPLVKRILINYECPRGHGICMDFTADELETKTKKKEKE